MPVDVSRALLSAAFAGLIPLLLGWAPPPTGDAAEIARLRTAVDELAADLETERVAARDELASLRSERAELQRQVRAAQARKSALQTLSEEAVAQAEAQDAQTRQWDAPTREAIAAARTYVERSLPFARKARLAALDRIERDLSAAQPDHARAVERLWRFLEEEEAMGREVSVGQQVLELDGEPQIVDVIRLSMALLYFRTQDGRYGWVFPAEEGWRQALLTDVRLTEIIERRFEAAEASQLLGPGELLLPRQIVDAGDGVP
ncbi:MAG: DUF3450 family protein [Myxococcota bacterium]